MVKIAIASASSTLAREVIDTLVASKKHDIVALVRPDPAQFPSLPGVEWVQTTYEDKSELVRLFKGVETVICFLAVHLDKDNAIQKRLIDASIEAGVRRYAPSEWATGVKLESSLDAMPWYEGKIKIAHYLEKLNEQKKVIEYTRFQVGTFMNYLAHPHKTTTHARTLPFLIDFDNQQAAAIEGSLDDVIVWTTVQDIAGVVARAVEYPGEWPAIGGITGTKATIGEVLKLGEAIGRPIKVHLLKEQDLEAEIRNAGAFSVPDLRIATPEQAGAFMHAVPARLLIAIHRGAYDITDEWNKLLPDYKFTQLEDFLKSAWGGK
ncbi:NAD(P)-binding protein [Daldinia caldariorum]|uniref:NAD(P)-binding protein n=1 Tax=Daldinia caldariorum TaxID=326644 RepID=UPI0020080143|nr:NAD(P)-binding protein [Daldinia caldariorum]KAI1472630.1 NAD(P)-binding protein [Daldinia caldariorum]